MEFFLFASVHIHELTCEHFLLEWIVDVFLSSSIDFDQNWEDAVEQNQNDYDPEGDEVIYRVVTASDVSEHIASHEPVVDYHDVEQRDEWATKVIEVDQIVEIWDVWVFKLGAVRSHLATKPDFSSDRIEVEDSVDGHYHAEEWDRQVFRSCHDDLKFFQFH